MTTPCCWPFCGADPKECDCADNVHTNDEKTNTSGETCIDSVPLPEPSQELAKRYGEGKDAQATEADRLAFEAWMRGHCWALCATWRGNQYKSDAEETGRLCPDAMRTRMLWAAWRDRGAVAADQLHAYGDERARAIAEDRNCWKAIADGEAELRAIADDELKVSEARIAELESLLKTVAIRAANFPDFPMGWHMPEVFKAVGMLAPEQPENDDTHDGLRARVAELEANLQNLREERDGFADGLKYWRQRAKSAEGHLPRADMDEAAKAVHMASNLSGIEWGELRWDQQHACYIAASAVVRAINSQRDARKPKNAAIAAEGWDERN